MTKLRFIAFLVWAILLVAIFPGNSQSAPNRNAPLERMFVMVSNSDGNDAEELSIKIGKTIPTDPVKFSRALKKHRSSVVRLDSLLGGLGCDFVDNIPAQSEELRKRIVALKSVKHRNLVGIASECIIELQRQLQVIEKSR